MKCILIVEDEPFIALDLAYACEDAGMHALTAATCAEAHELVAANRIDGAVLDVNLGRGETCERIAETLRAKGIPFVLNTGDLNRAGEFLRDINAPIISKPNVAGDVIGKLMAMA